VTLSQNSQLLSDGWELAPAPAGASEPADLDSLIWKPANVPGTVAGVVPEAGEELDRCDWWFRTHFDCAAPAAAEQVLLRLDGIATDAQVFLNGEAVLESHSMFREHAVDISDVIRESNELLIQCEAIGPKLAISRRPRARWRSKLVDDGNLRFFRTMLMGRAPSFAAGPPVIGPWRPVWLQRRTGLASGDVRIRNRLEASGEGVVTVGLTVTALGGRPLPSQASVTVTGSNGSHVAQLQVTDRGNGVAGLSGTVRIPKVDRWWPHTHGDPVLHELSISAGSADSAQVVHSGNIGFRSLSWPVDWEQSGFRLAVNGAEVFMRGALWTPQSLSAPHQTAEQLRETLELVRGAGMNMVRIPGISCYESDDFYDLCDQLGILVWQDFMFANLDYPLADPEFRETVEQEIRGQLARLAGRPSLAVLCGGSEVAQQVTMLGLDPALARTELHTQLLPALVEEAGADAAYVANSPWGGALPFRPNAGVGNYFGVGAYLRDLADARLADVKFASECLAFSNVPEAAALEALDAPGGLTPVHPAWKSGVPRDAGAGWDFEDVRDHYLRLLYDLDPVALRWTDVERYLELSRAVTGEVMAEVLGDWRRPDSACAGALILWLRDIAPGAGWGLLDHRGLPKPALHHLRRALNPQAIWITDEGMNGMAVHVANDRAAELRANLRLALYRDSGSLVDQVSTPVVLEPHGVLSFDAESLLGRFLDISYAYRFGRSEHNVVVASLESGAEPGEGLISQGFRFIGARPSTTETVNSSGLEATLVRVDAELLELRLRSERLLHVVRVGPAQVTSDDDGFSLEPGVKRRLRLRGLPVQGDLAAVSLTALNLRGQLTVELT
jgi:beta-mannosidase